MDGIEISKEGVRNANIEEIQRIFGVDEDTAIEIQSESPDQRQLIKYWAEE